jgi:glycosyltransferase involved in cell wall biosynthesis
MVLPDFPTPDSAPNPAPVPAETGTGTAEVRTMLPYRPISPTFAIVPTVTVVIPARNEAANLPHVFRTLPPWVNEIIVVDGHSVDDTVAVAHELCPQARVITQPGRGKGDALIAGFEAATGDILVAMDADGSTDGAEIIQFVGALVCGADYAKGSRFNGSGGSSDITVGRRYGNWLLGSMVNRIFRTQFTDLCYGYNAFWTRHLDALDLDCPGFEIETMMNIRAAKAGLRIAEVPSFERPRLNGESNLSVVSDGWRILKLILRERSSRVAGRPRRAEPEPVMPSPLPMVADAAEVQVQASVEGA